MKKIISIVTGLSFLAGVAGAGVIYKDDFNKTDRVQGGGYTQVLKASVPTVTAGGQWWKCYWSSGSIALGINVSGTMNTYTSDSKGYYRNAFLDFTPESGKIYTLTVDMSVADVVNGSGFITAGFAANTEQIDTFATPQAAWAAGKNGSYLNGEYTSAMTTAVAGWRLNANWSVNTYKDVLYGNPVSAGWATNGFNRFVVILNTEGEDWTAEWKMNGTSIRTETYTEDPVIRNVFLGAEGVANASFQKFSLTVNTDLAGPEIEGVPVSWINEYFGSTNGFSGAADADSDGISNAGEYQADTDPTDPASLLEMLGLEFNASNVVVTYQNGGSNSDVIVEYRPSAASGWEALVTNSAPSVMTNTFLHSTAAASGWYRTSAFRP